MDHVEKSKIEGAGLLHAYMEATNFAKKGAGENSHQRGTGRTG
jgi:hypothetical protein